MESILFDEIPSLDLAHFYEGTSATKKGFVSDLGRALNNIGFVAIRNHFLDDNLQNGLYAAMRKFFALPDTVKLEYERVDLAGQRSEMSLAALSSCVSPATPKRWEDISAGEFLNQRLADIGLKR